LQINRRERHWSGADWQNDFEQSAVFAVRGRSNLTAMTFDNPVADSQA
jgi:hypothetical protein